MTVDTVAPVRQTKPAAKAASRGEGGGFDGYLNRAIAASMDGDRCSQCGRPAPIYQNGMCRGCLKPSLFYLQDAMNRHNVIVLGR